MRKNGYTCTQTCSGTRVEIPAAALVVGRQDPETALQTIRHARGFEVPETNAQRQWILDFSSWLATVRAALPDAARLSLADKGS